MNRIISLAVLIVPVIFLSHQLEAQDMIQPGHIYQPGDTVRAPRLGMMSRIPEGWAGILPRETEMFLLMSQENPQSSIYAFGVEDTRESMRSRWMNGPGLEVENNIKLVRSSEVYERGDVIAADLMIENITNDKTGYVEAKCSEYNRCLVLLLIVPEAFLEKSKEGLKQFMDNAVLAEPTMGDIYENFSWANFFGGKYLATRQINPYDKAKRNNQIWMCPDGSFKSHIKVKGFASIDKKIKGDKSGKWEAIGTGPNGKLILHFKNLDTPVEIPTLLQDDQLFINEIRYFVMQNNSCK